MSRADGVRRLGGRARPGAGRRARQRAMMRLIASFRVAASRN